MGVRRDIVTIGTLEGLPGITGAVDRVVQGFLFDGDEVDVSVGEGHGQPWLAVAGQTVVTVRLVCKHTILNQIVQSNETGDLGTNLSVAIHAYLGTIV